MQRLLIVLLVLTHQMVSYAQNYRWQQKVKYKMDIVMDVDANTFTGTQKLEYWNNSPDTLKKVFYHLYWNAFQPGSMMDVRSQLSAQLFIFTDKDGNEISDFDKRFRDFIYTLKPQETGYQKVIALKMNGIVQPFKIQETILEVQLTKPIPPLSKVVFDMNFEAQVPLQTRRGGRDNPVNKVRYAMGQWYPKLCAYDEEGWHPTPYVQREYYGVFGDYEVNITIDKSYVLGGTGYLQNANQFGYGYETPGTKVIPPSTNKVTWKFFAPNVHDFMWCADNDYAHESKQVKDGPLIHIFYKKSTADAKQWRAMLDSCVIAYPFMARTFGAYPYKQFSIVHGSNGATEYPMSTMVKTHGMSGAIHEWLHSWYQGVLATNESLYSWMDEGFTNYAEDRVLAWLRTQEGFAQKENYASYFQYAKSPFTEPLTTHADHFETNYAYNQSAYVKGSVFVEQLGYIVGNKTRDKILLKYYSDWKFKHPNANDFIRVAEKVSGIQLDWYKEYWVNTNKTINYSIDSLWEEDGKTKIRLRNEAEIPMPIDVELTFKDGTKEAHYVPMYLMFGQKQDELNNMPRKVYEPWKWTHPTYTIETSRKLLTVKTVEIDPSLQMADVDRRNNKLELRW